MTGTLAVRRALGASARQIASQLAVETLLIAGSGVALGVLAAAVLLPHVLAMIPFGYIPAEATIAIDWRLVAVAFALTLATAGAAGFFPAWRAATIDPARLIKQGDALTTSRRTGWYREIFTIVQLTLAIVVLASGLSLVRGMREVMARDPGFAADDVWTVRTALDETVGPDAAAPAYERLLRQLSSTPGIRDAAIGSALPTDDLSTILVSREGGPAGAHATLESAALSVSPEYFRVLDIRLREGRAISDADRRDAPPVVVVSETLAERLWPGGHAIGARLTVQSSSGNRPVTVIGIANDVRIATTSGRPPVLMFFPLAQRPTTIAVLTLKAGPTGQYAAASDAVRRVDPSLPLFEPETLSQARIDTLGPQWLAVVLMTAFTLAVLALSAIGIHAVISQSLQERGREIWIRLALGASPRATFRAELGTAARLAGVAGVLGAALAVVVERATAVWLPEAHGPSPAAIGLAILIVGTLALATTAPAAYRAASVELAGVARE